MHVRRLTAADARAYQVLRLAGIAETPESFGRTFDEVSQQPIADVADMIERHAVFGAHADDTGGALVGIAGLVVLDGVRRAHKATLFGMYVDPSARGRGAGAVLIDAIVASARGRVEEVQLTVGAGNGAARALYERAGFRQYGYERRALRLASSFSDELLMALPLRVEPQQVAAPTSGFVGPRKRSVTIAGHETSISLEPQFWDALEAAATTHRLPLSALVAQIDALRIERPDPPNLASALRTWLLSEAIPR